MSTSCTFIFLLLCVTCFGGYWYENYRTFNGTNNNAYNYGSTESPLCVFPRKNDIYMNTSYSPRYLSDGQTPNSTLPSGMTWYSARNISNIVMASRGDYPPNSTSGASYLHMFWGQFLDHDISLTMGATAEWDIEILPNDPTFATLGANMTFVRSGTINVTNDDGVEVRFQYNGDTSFIDGSTIYGSSTEISDELRNGSSCFLKTINKTIGYTGHGTYIEEYLRNQGEADVDYVANDGNSNGMVNTSTLFFSGDVRCNENPVLTSLHTLFTREHNRICATTATSGDVEQDFQNARRWVIAYLQQITLNEYLASTIGETLSPWTAYDSSIDPRVASYFSTSGFRYGHTEILDYIPVYDAVTGDYIIDLPFEENFFNPQTVVTYGADNLLAGVVRVLQNEVDPFYSVTPRNFLFGGSVSSTQVGTDLAARNIQRGRDHGLPLYNEIRVILGLSENPTFANVTSDTALQAVLTEAYPGGPSDMDSYVGGLSEDHYENADVGELIYYVIKETYQRLRDGDQWYFENTNVTGFTADEVAEISQTKLKDIILRNTRMTTYPCSPMYQSSYADFNCGTGTNVVTYSSSYTWTVGNYTATFNLTDLGNNELKFDLSINNAGGWVALGIPNSYTNPLMLNSDVAMITKLGSTATTYYVYDYFIGPLFRHESCSNGICEDTLGTDPVGVDNLIDVSATTEDGYIIASWTRLRDTGDDRDNVLADAGEDQAFLVATGALYNENVLFYHQNNKIIVKVVMPGVSSSPSPTPTTSTSSSSANVFSAVFFIFCFLVQFVMQ